MDKRDLPVFTFRGQEMYYDYEWLDGNTFNFIFGDGYFVDGDGDDYYIDVLYSVKEDKITSTAVYQDQVLTVDNALYEHEQEEIKRFIRLFLKKREEI